VNDATNAMPHKSKALANRVKVESDYYLAGLQYVRAISGTNAVLGVDQKEWVTFESGIQWNDLEDQVWDRTVGDAFLAIGANEARWSK
jgi:hypothetical protein